MCDYESSLFAALREACAEDWNAYVDHEFVRRLGDASLPRTAYVHYLRQDYLFLVHFARAWALAVVKSDRIDEMRACAATVHALIDEEMRLHIETCAAEGISEAALAIEMCAFAEDVHLTIHPHPTLSEAMMESFKHALGEAVHALNR